MKPGLETLILRCKWTEMERTSLSLVLETRGGLGEYLFFYARSGLKLFIENRMQA